VNISPKTTINPSETYLTTKHSLSQQTMRTKTKYSLYPCSSNAIQYTSRYYYFDITSQLPKKGIHSLIFRLPQHVHTTIMALSCLSHLLTSFITSAPPVLQPTHTGLIYRAPLPRAEPSTFPAAPNLPTSAFAFENVDAATCQARLEQQQKKQQAMKLEKERREWAKNWGEDGTSWIRKEGGDGQDEQGWNVGWEKVTQMEVRRKGRGIFAFEKRVMEGCGGLNEVRGEEGKLADGFPWEHWVVDSEGQTSDRIRGAEVEKSHVDAGEAVEEVETRNGMDVRRDSGRFGIGAV
jgi:hypothetical protein